MNFKVIILVGFLCYSCTESNPQAINFIELKQQIESENVAVFKKKVESVKEGLNQSDSLGNTLLHYAIQSDQLPIAKLLLLHGADPNQLNTEGKSPLDLARQMEMQNLIDLIHQFQFQDWEQNGKIFDQAHLEYAILNNNVKILRAFYERGIKVNQMELGNGFSPLVAAIFSGGEETALFILEQEANPNDNFDTRPVICMAAMFNQKEVVKKLLEKGAKVDSTDGTKTTALNFAANENNLEIVKLLLEAGADPTIKDMAGENAIDKAKKKGHRKVLALFES